MTVSSGFADYYDGESAQKQRVRVGYDDGDYGKVLQIELPDGEHMVLWPAHRIRTLPDQASYDAMVLGLDNGDAARLIVRDKNVALMITQYCPHAADTIPAPKARLSKALIVMAGCVAAMVFFFLVALPTAAGLLATRIDPETEVAMGDLTYDQLRFVFTHAPGVQAAQCTDPAGMAAYQKLLDRVAQGVDLPYPITATVFDDRARPVTNAFALPGGRVVFFDSMLNLAETPEEIAAVMAHEIGHVYHRHGVKNTLQGYAAMAVTTLLFADVGGIGIGIANAFISSGYSREAEVEADVFASEQLDKVGLPASALGTLFQRLLDEHGEAEGIAAHFTSHPQLSSRIANADAAGDVVGAPLLTAPEWAALQNICDQTDANGTTLPVAAISR